MPTLVGRDRDIAAALGVYTSAKTTPSARTLFIEGPSGIGKTALILELEDRVASESLVLRARARRFERAMPFSLADRLARNLQTTLEGALRRRPAVVIVDDTQFADNESLETIAAATRASANRPLLTVFTRSDENPRDVHLQADASIALRELDANAATQIARAHYPGASPDVIDAVIANARGIPYEIVAIAAQAARRHATGAAMVDFSSRAAIAVELAALAPAQRTMLQLLSLLADPVELPLLRELIPDAAELAALLAALADTHVRRDGEEVRLDHELTASAIAETIAMTIPLHRRIIAAMQRRGAKCIADRLALAEQTLAAGDRALARGVVLDLAFAAAGEHLTRAVLWASERHLELGEPPDERFIDFYRNFFAALMDTRQYTRAESIVAHALSEAQHRGLSGMGSLVAQLVLAQWTVERHEAAKASYERYAQAFADPRDLQLLREAAPWLRAV
ncbi:MAG TPA: ATP-binding protein [Candidatus Baltobacteraceae bacterium]|nr:ATP-binding protein [Candidatus Baltobacteraceae bacterium]